MTVRPILFSAPEAARFEASVCPEPNSGCWLWLGRVNAKGYGRFGNEMAHRTALRLECRPVPPGLEVDHLCRIRCCVNPAHLEVVTHRTNLMRGDTLPARAAAKTQCPCGHPLSGSNLAIRSGKRRCKACDRERGALGYEPRGRHRRRRPHLTDDERRRIKSLIADGASHSTIAAEMNVSVATVSRVRCAP